MKYRVPRARKALTLIELVVVMVILIALAGILVPLFPSMLTRAHTSTGATNGTEISKLIQMYYTTNFGYPDNLDDVGGGAGTLTGIVRGGDGTDYTTITLTANTLPTLIGSGIVSVLPVTTSAAGNQTNWSPTFFPYGPSAIANLPASTNLGVSSALVGLRPTTVVREFGLNLNPATSLAQFIVLGLGKYSSMQGSVMQDAPVHFDDDPGGNPSLAYARYGLVFQIADDGGNALNSAKFIGTMEFSGTGVSNAGDHLQDYYNLK